MSVDEAMREIKAIERLIGPYEHFSYEAKKVLAALRDLKNALESMDEKSIKRIIREMSNIDELAAPYRGYDFVEETLVHAKKLLDELRKIVGE